MIRSARFVLKALLPGAAVCSALALLLATPIAARAQQAPLPAASDLPDAVASVPADYRLDIGDTIRVDVPRHTDVSMTVLIPADGMVRLPRLRAPVSARGKTSAALADALAKGWKHVFRLRPGQVTVAVTAQRMRRVTVRGNAIENREVSLLPNWRLANVIAALGGTRAPLDRITATITNPLRPAPVTVKLSTALSDPEAADNVPLLEGDTVVADAPRTIRLYVQGEGPRGVHEVEHHFGLRRALTQIQYNYTALGATGSLRDARIYRKAVEGDLSSEDIVIPINLKEVMTGEGTDDVKLRDQDLLFIPPSENYVYVFGEAGGSRKQRMPEDRKTYLIDVIGNAGGTTGVAKIGQIAVLREVNGKSTKTVYDFGKYLKDQDPRHNPEILAKDIVYVPKVGQKLGIGEIFTGINLYSVLKGFLGGAF